MVIVDDKRRKAPSFGETEIDVVSKILAVPKKDARHSAGEQEENLIEECAMAVAKEIIHLTSCAHPNEPLNLAMPEYNPVLHRVEQNYTNSKFFQHALPPLPPVDEGTPSTVAEIEKSSTPTAVRLDEDGLPITTQEKQYARKRKEEAAEVFDHRALLAYPVPDQQALPVKALVECAASTIDNDSNDYDVKFGLILQKGKMVDVKAKDVIDVGTTGVGIARH